MARGYWAAGAFVIVTISMFLVVRVESPSAAIVLLSFAALANACIGGVVGAVLTDTVPEQAGSQGGILQVFQTMPGIIAPIITGIIVDATQSFENAFYLASIIAVSGLIVSLLFLKPPSQLLEKGAELQDSAILDQQLSEVK
ncbi:MFS transporter [Bacillus sp. N9]